MLDWFSWLIGFGFASSLSSLRSNSNSSKDSEDLSEISPWAVRIVVIGMMIIVIMVVSSIAPFSIKDIFHKENAPVEQTQPTTEDFLKGTKYEYTLK